MTSHQAAGNAYTAASVASTPTTSSSGGSNMGKYLMAAQGISALMGVMGGVAGQRAASDEAAMMNRQAQIALEEARFEALKKRDEVIAFREEQAHEYLDSGVLLQGSPMLVLSETVRKGNQEINAIMRRGNAVAELYRAKAQQTARAGSYGAMSSILGAGAGLANAWILGSKIGLFGNKTPAVPSSTPASPLAQPELIDWTGIG